MAVSELLRLIIDADTSGATRGITQLGAVSKRELSKSEQSIQKWGNALTTVGAGMVAVGAVGVAGLARAAKASEDAHLSVVKLENTLGNMPQLAGENSKQFIDLADNIQDVTAADADQIVAAEAMLGTFRLTASEIKTITPLVVDYSRKFGVDLVDAATQVGKALDGNVGALKRNGVSIDEAAFAADHFTAVQEALAEQVGGFAEAEGATFAGSVERLKNQLGDLAEGVGVGAVDAFSSMFGVVEGLTDRFEDLDPATQSLVGKLATFGSVGLIAAGGLSILVGQALKMHHNFSLAKDAISNFAGAGGLGALARNLAKGGIIIGGLLLLEEVLDRTFGDQTGVASANLGRLEADLVNFARTGRVSGEALEVFGKGFGDLADNLNRVDLSGVDDARAKVDRFAASIPGVGRALDTGFAKDVDNAKQAIDDFDKALASIAAADPELAFDILQQAANEAGVEIDELKPHLDDYNAAVGNVASNAAIAGDDVDEFGRSMSDSAEGTEEAISALQEYSDTLAAMTDPVFAAMNAVNGVRDAQAGLADAELAVLEAQVALDTAIKDHGANSTEAAEATRTLEDAERGLSDAQWATVESAAEADSALAGLKDAAENGDVTIAQFKSTLAQWVDQGFLTQQQADDAAEAVSNLANQASDADEERVDIPVTTPGTVEAQTQLRRTKEEAFAIPRSRHIDVSMSGYGGVQSLVDRINRKMAELHDRTLTVRTNFVTTGQGGSGGIPLFHEGGIVPGPRGQEVAAILQAGERVVSLAEMDAMQRGAPAGVGAGTKVVDQRTVIYQISNPDPKSVVEAIQRYERQNGRRWRN